MSSCTEGPVGFLYIIYHRRPLSVSQDVKSVLPPINPRTFWSFAYCLQHSCVYAWRVFRFALCRISAISNKSAQSRSDMSLKKRLWLQDPHTHAESESGNKVRCTLCPWLCLLNVSEYSDSSVRDDSSGLFKTLFMLDLLSPTLSLMSVCSFTSILSWDLRMFVCLNLQTSLWLFLYLCNSSLLFDAEY